MMNGTHLARARLRRAGFARLRKRGSDRPNTEVTVRGRFLVVLSLAVSALVSVPAFAHHGNAAFDAGKRLALKGTVTEWVWANPHCWLKFDVKDDKGEVIHWLAEETNPPGLINSGWY